MIQLLAHSLPRSPVRASPATHRKTEKEKQVADGRGGWQGAESYDSMKALSSMNHSILSASYTKEFTKY
jgi:hypothetical protein